MARGKTIPSRRPKVKSTRASGPLGVSGTVGPVAFVRPGQSDAPFGESGTIGPVAGYWPAYDPRDFHSQHVMSNRRRVGLGWMRDLPDWRDTTIDRISPKLKAKFDAMPKVKGPTASDPRQRAETEFVDPFERVQASLRKRAKSVPRNVDLSGECSPIEDQGPLGSCTAQAAAGMIEYMQRRAFGEYTDASRLFIYKTTRKLLGWDGDTGAFLRTTMKAVALFGAPPESEHPYVVGNFDEEPDSYLYAYASNYRALQYLRLDPAGTAPNGVLDGVKAALAAKFPVMFGFTVFSSLTDDAKIPFPASGDSQSGGHAVLAVGYNDAIQCANAQPGALLIRNSWGRQWGGDASTGADRGYGWLPYDYVLRGLASDFWVGFKFDWIATGLFD